MKFFSKKRAPAQRSAFWKGFAAGLSAPLTFLAFGAPLETPPARKLPEIPKPGENIARAWENVGRQLAETMGRDGRSA